MRGKDAVTILLAALWIPMTAGGGSAAMNCVAGGCHKEIIAPKYLHGPLAAEEAGAEGCESCHVPAGKACTATAAGEFRFKTSQDRLCLLCHERGTGTQHTMNRSKCLSCHTPHASEESYKLMRAGS